MDWNLMKEGEQAERIHTSEILEHSENIASCLLLEEIKRKRDLLNTVSNLSPTGLCRWVGLYLVGVGHPTAAEDFAAVVDHEDGAAL
jgi:hypothetical protein